ncbi:unnamed protein product [Allacma fusca]|uniref:Uncharacterized protein n=1 Tax=Allacma fusca TaxID=39272 RepID=A0A8J2KXZ6_9HEXA|nr:unnamed protein product [Allacma fusca]
MKSWLAEHHRTRVRATTTFDAFLELFGVSEDEYENVILRLSVEFGRVLPARLVANAMVNDYNQVLADAWKGHMDMQIVVDSSRLIDYVGKAPNHVASKQLLAVAQAQGRTFPPLRVRNLDGDSASQRLSWSNCRKTRGKCWSSHNTTIMRTLA